MNVNFLNYKIKTRQIERTQIDSIPIQLLHRHDHNIRKLTSERDSRIEICWQHKYEIDKVIIQINRDWISRMVRQIWFVFKWNPFAAI